MSLDDRIHNHAPFQALPIWRRVVLVCGLAFCLLVGAMTVDKEFDIYGADPDHPVQATGQVYPVHVNHGHLRYATKKEREDLNFWEIDMGSWVGVPALAFVFLWLLYRPRRS